MEFKAHIEKLVGAANWSKWKRQIELLLRHHDVCGDRKCPSLPAEASSEAFAAHSSGQQLDRLMEKFFHNDKELEDDIVSHIAKLQRNFSELNDELRCVAKTTLPDLLRMSRIMSTLPSEYFEFKSVGGVGSNRGEISQ
ncbi:uncharacterized protein TNCV_3202611 [Trichonephila clavipes]|nr:uncharacterized protein TNCV_3202611 [Trichonephila clavipes]